MVMPAVRSVDQCALETFCVEALVRVALGLLFIWTPGGGFVGGVAPVNTCFIPPPSLCATSTLPASGKTTQCELLAKRFDLPHINVGDLLFEEVKAKTKIGLEAKVRKMGGKSEWGDFDVGLSADCVVKVLRGLPLRTLLLQFTAFLLALSYLPLPPSLSFPLPTHASMVRYSWMHPRRSLMSSSSAC